ncbi:alpha-2-macroglobulin family protein [Xanthocytophaga flava]|uniref:alpha-2-macroglobulin family protein n=1 Tax=Xanthocytophaga flava TaxID=3048013 RepID=UPI0028D456E3|nr:alpha-2-macroglobulin family protein [Xanthocytophaga flavus]MDJ1471666.1 alpha-2-macroglobulin family protein [Xanthocytophaga flavus]
MLYKNLIITLIPALFTFFAYAQNKTSMPNYDYSGAWKQVQQFEDKGLPESALKVVNEIYQKAKTEKNSAQLVKAVIHQFKFADYKEENAFVKNINELRTQISSADFPVKPVLHSMLAEMYWNYYTNNRWRFRNRSETVNFNNEDIETWGLDKLIQETFHEHQLALQNAEESKKLKIDVYQEVLHSGNTEGRVVRPTLYDFLAHRALGFYTSEEVEITKPAYSFTISSGDYLKDAQSFANLQLASQDTLSQKFHALQIYQELIRFHLKDADPDALVTLDIERLSFVKQHLTLTTKNELYLAALQSLEEKTIKNPVSTRVTHAIAQIWVEKGGQYKPLQSDEHKFDLKKAYEICDQAKKRFPQSDGAALCHNLQISLEQKSLAAKVEKVNLPNLPFRTLVTYRNVTEVHWRLVKVNREEVHAQRMKWRNNYNVDQEQKFLEWSTAKPALKTGKYTLSDDKEYQPHSTEIKLDGLAEGEYMVLLSNTPDFKTTKNGLAYAFTTISSLSYIHRNLDEGSTEFFVLHRQTGEPMAGIQAQVFVQKYSSKLQDYVYNKENVYVTDAKGRFVVPYRNAKSYDDRNFFVEFSTQKDKLSMRDIDDEGYYGTHLYQYPHGKAETHTNAILFLDRAIYRPGQTLYYKGLVHNTDGRTSTILPNYTTTVTFHDVNHQVVATQTVTTNEYGTFSGTFTTPSKGLMGQMYLNVSGIGIVYFSVEEYKRPKFEVKFNPVKGSFRLGETIQTEGTAQAYSGANIDGAQVAYRVVRTARFPIWWWYWRGYYPTSPEMEITHGVTQTDATGKFQVSFTAIPDESVDKSSDPTFDYKVYADVTDINGETHSSQMVVSIGYKALVVGVDAPDIDKADAKALEKKWTIRTTNLSGEFEAAKGSIKIWKLKNPSRAFRERLWERPDKHVFSQEEYYKLFPQDLYAEESNFYKWEKEKEVLSVDFNTSEAKEFTVNNLKSWSLGKYQLEITSTDKYGQAVKETSYFTVMDSDGKTLAYPTMFEISSLKATAEPGEKATLLVGTATDKAKMLYEVEQDGKILSQEWITLKNEQHRFEIPVKEEYRGNIMVHYSFVRDGRLYTENTTIVVPYTNKQLEIQFETFRDKLQPGQQEQWKLKLAGKQADKVMAEMVATLYDASLDVFRPHGWYASFYNAVSGRLGWQSQNGFEEDDFRSFQKEWSRSDYRSYSGPSYDNLNWFGYYFGGGGRLYRSKGIMADMKMESAKPGAPMVKQKKSAMKEEESVDLGMAEAAPAVVADSDAKNSSRKQDSVKGGIETNEVDMSNVKVRTNFSETAFFYPHLLTNDKGEISINFTIPEALTRWKMLGFAHTKELQSGSVVKELVTQKDLMVVPNQPRFFREGDKMQFAVKITSLSDKDLNGQAQLEFFDALTMQPVTLLTSKTESQKSFSLKAKQSTILDWSIAIPEGIQAISYKVVAKAGDFSDGESMVLPVVTNRMLVTETMPLPIRGKQTKEFKLEKLVNNNSKTLKSHRFTLEFTSNPAWYAVQALPYLMEYPYECVEQTFSRFYANSMASHIANSNPKIKRVFDTWKNYQPDALLSNLEKNQELKSALLEETPWVLNAKDESQRKRNVALLFDLNRMADEQERALDKVQKAQLSSGGFSWFPGFPEDRYMTQHIVSGLGHLDALGVKSVREDNRTWQMTQKAIGFLDSKMHNDYEYLKAEAKKGRIKLEEKHIGYFEYHYLYTRSYFKDVEVNSTYKEAFNYYLGQAKKYWLNNNTYMEGMVALALHRFNDKTVPAAIIKSLNERALKSEEMGMYWKNEYGYYWYQAPIETQALLIEVYDEVANDQKAVDELKVWLLKQKQTQDWKTTKATSEACYALLRRGSDALADDRLVEVSVGKEKIDPLKQDATKVEAGTGYFKMAWTGSEITPEMGKITVSKPTDGVAWGAVYWQYFEQLDKITPAETPLKLKKQLFLQTNTDRGPVISPITEGTELKVGDLVKVRIELRTDRTMEYVHLKDMRAAGFEPVETISRSKYQDGLWYYESPRDLATNFFMGYLPKGTYVFEYALRVSQKGDFSNGISTIQCMYAPEFSSHSEGVRVKIAK